MRAIKILQVTYTMNGGGAETLMMNILRAMDREKFHFDFLENTECGEDGSYDEEIASYGCRIYRLRSFTKKPFEYISTCKKFFQEHSDYDVIHGHFLQASAPLYFHYAKSAGALAIAHAHSTSDGGGMRNRILAAARYPIRRQADIMLACSKEAGRYMFGERAVDGPSFHVLRNGFDLSRYNGSRSRHSYAKRDLGIEGRFVIGHVGRFREEKNHSFLIEVFSKVLQLNPNAYLLLVGSGPLEEKIKALVREKGLMEDVMFVGSVNDPLPYYDAMDLFLFPSLFEGLGNALLEAQACGLPIVVSAESVIDGENNPCRENILPLSLALSAGDWAKACVTARPVLAQSDCVHKISDAGFDIADVVEFLSSMYSGEHNELLHS